MRVGHFWDQVLSHVGIEGRSTCRRPSKYQKGMADEAERQ